MCFLFNILVIKPRGVRLTKDVVLGQHSSSVRAEQLGPCTLTQKPPGPLALALC